ncbi:MAG: LysR family transcriptional regulator [Candidatus Competibacterales bacterium]
MDAIKPSHLRVFATVARLGSVSVAAETLHRSPSAVSMSLKHLETMLGKPLFEGDGKARLTPLGRYVFEVACEELARFDRAMARVWAVARNELGEVSLAVLPSFANAYLPVLVARFGQRYPGVKLVVRDDNTAAIEALVAGDVVDVGIASPPGGASVRYEPLGREPLGVVCAANHPLVQRGRPLVWEDLVGYPFIANGTCAYIDHPAHGALVAGATLEARNTTSLLALVAEGLGVTTLPRLSVPRGRGLAFCPTAYPELERTLGLVTPAHRTLSPAAAGLVRVVQELVIQGLASGLQSSMTGD